MASPVLVERSQGWHRAVLNRPEHGNSLNPELVHRLRAALETCAADDEARVFLIEGHSGHFCSGMDLQAAAEGKPARGLGGSAFLDLLRRMVEVDVVVVSVVDGTASGGGLGLVAASDFAYATPSSTFCLPEALWGLMPCIVAPFLVRRIGLVSTQQLTLSTLAIDAERAERWRLIDAIVDTESQDVAQLIRRARRVAPGITGEAKRYLATLSSQDDSNYERALDELDRLLGSPGVLARLRRFAHDGVYPWQDDGSDLRSPV